MKKIMSVLLVGIMVLMMAGCSSSGGGSSTDWAKNVEVQVPAKAGGGTDVMSRTLGNKVQTDSGSTITIVNNTDGGGIVAAEKIRTAKADGSVLLQYHSGLVLKIATGVYDKSITNDFSVIGVALPVEEATNVLITSADSGIQTVNDLIEVAKSAPGEMMFGIETGSTTHIQSAIFAKKASIDIKLVEAGSDTEKLTALVGGNINACFVNPNQAKQYLEAGKIVALAVIPITTDGGRSSVLPDVPSFTEEGINFNFMMLNALILGPKDMDFALVQKIHDYYESAALSDEVNDVLGSAGMEMKFVSIEEGIKIIQDMQAEMNPIVEELGLKQN